MPKRPTAPPVRHNIECEVDGQVHRGTYEVTGGVLTVHGAGGSKSAQPGARPDVMARIILGELVREADGKGWA